MLSIQEQKYKVHTETQEIRKKIQLSEGQGKAFYEESEAEKKANKETINQLRTQIKLLHVKLQEAKLGSERAVEEVLLSKKKKRTGSAPSSARVTKSENTIKLSEYRLHDYVKRLNFLQHTSKLKEERLESIKTQLEEIGPRRAKKEQELIKYLKKDYVKLETEMGRVLVQLQESEGIKRRYQSMITSLKGDEAAQRTSMDVLYSKLTQEKEALKILKDSRRNAERTRDDLRSCLHLEEDHVFEARRERERRLEDYKKKVDERSPGEINTISNRKMSLLRTPTQRLSPTMEDVETESPHRVNLEMERFFHIFSKLKETLGVTSFEEVMERLSSQKNTRSHLHEMRESTLLELSSYKQDKELLQQELHRVKYAATEGSVKLDGAYEDLDNTMKELVETKLMLEEIMEEQVNNLKSAKATFELMIDNLREQDDNVPEKQKEFSFEYLYQIKDYCFNGIDTCLKNIDELDIKHGDEEFDEKFSLMETYRSDRGVAVLPENLRVIFPAFKGTKPVGPQVDEGADSGEEEESISRRYIKKQAQIVVEAKSRKRNRPVSNFRS